MTKAKTPLKEIFEGLPEDKTKTKSKTKTKIAKVIEPILQPESEFIPITFVSDTTYKLNYIGIRRILIKIGRYIPVIKIPVFKIPATKFNLWEKYSIWWNKHFSEGFNLWSHYSNWWNNHFNKKNSYVLAHNELEIVESDK